MTHGDEREQSRNSPLYLLRAGLEAANARRYSLDPASNPDALVDAEVEVWFGDELGVHPVPIVRKPGRLRGDGIVLDWRPYRHIFGNPPWNNLEPFFEKAYHTACHHRVAGTNTWSIQMLVPLRPHRVHWRWVYSANAWCLLRPVAFEGFEEKMAIPCVWLYWGSDVFRFRRVFHRSHGMVLTRIPRFAMLPTMPRTSATQSVSVDLTALKNDHIAYRMLFSLASDLTAEELEPHLRSAFAGKPVGDLVEFMDTFDEPHPLPIDQGDAWQFQSRRHYIVVSRIAEAARAILNQSVILMASDGETGVARSTRAAKPGKKAAKKSTRAKPARPGKKAAKKSTRAKPAKPGKKAAKKSTRAKPAKRNGPASPVMKIHNGQSAQVGDTICRFDAAGKVGVIMGFEGKYAKVRWGAAKTAVKVLADELVLTVRDTKGTRAAKSDLEQVAANDAPAKLSKSERLDQAVSTEILAGRTTEFSCKDVARAMSISDATALRSIKRLMEAGKVKAVGAGRKSAYMSTVPLDAAPEAEAG